MLDGHGSKTLPPGLIEHAMSRLTITTDPMLPELLRLAEDARRLGYLPSGDLSGLLDRTLLDTALRDRAARRGASP